MLETSKNLWTPFRKSEKDFICPKCKKAMGELAMVIHWDDKAHIICEECQIVWRWKLNKYTIVDIESPLP